MADGRVLLGPDTPVRVEVVGESAHTRVTRLFFPGRTAIRKQPLGPDAGRRLRHERAMLERLRGLDGIAQLVDAPVYPEAIVLADVGGSSLAGAATPRAVDELIGLAAALVRAVAGMHGRGVMHCDISPANVVLSADGTPCLVDFALATSVAELRPEFTHHSEIVGTLAYLAPEQTGRTGRPVDQRADLYALGATLYELATGAPPFGTGDPLRLTHDHLARVPVPPAEVNPAVRGPLSQIILHLLEKEPDHRYQTAVGVLRDLERVRDARRRPAAVLRVGEHDVALRLVPPSRLVGRDAEMAALGDAFDEAVAGRCRGVLIGGASGVGKTALVDQLRPVVTGGDGWFVTGKFDPYRRDLEFDAIQQAFRALGRLLLAEPEDELTEVRARILASVGGNAGLLTATVAELAALLPVPAEPGDPLTAQARAQRAAAELLRAVASRKRPLVVFVDDLQWAGRTPLGVVDLVLSGAPVGGLLLVGAYREDEVDPAHPLAAPLSRWRDQPGVRHLRLDNLPASGSVAMVAEMLHVDPAAAAGLAAVLARHTSGNPYETVELLNTLRRDGLLSATATGWRWDAAAVRARLGESAVPGLLAARVEAMPARSRGVVEAMACLGGRAELSLLQTATGEPADVVEQVLAPVLDEGLLAVEPGARQAVRFRHDRLREAVLAGLDPQRRRDLQLGMARRLAGVPELFAVAAEQYLPVIDAVDDAAERRLIVGLLRRAADQATLIGNHALVNTLLAAALPLIDPDQTATLIEVHTGQHAALYSLGLLEEADQEYRTIAALCPTAVDRAGATCVQVRSLTHRNRLTEAIGLGLESLRELGIAVPPADKIPADLDHQFEYLYRWLGHTTSADELARPDITDRTVLASTGLLNATLAAAYLALDYPMHVWLSLEVLRIWLEHGPGPTMLGPASIAALGVVVLRGDYTAGYQALRRMVALGETRGHEPDTSQARWVFAILSIWFEPMEIGVQEGQRAREGLIAGGDLANAGYTYYTTVPALLDCAPSLDAYVAEVDAALAFAGRTGSEQTGEALDSHRWLADVLRSESSAATPGVPIDRHAGNPLALLFAHITHAIAAAIFGDPVALARHTASAMPLLSAATSLYPTAVARLLRGLALAAQARTTTGDERAGLLAELDEVTRWLTERAADAPDNFLHLVRFLDAERAWAVGDFRAAVLAFDAALRELVNRQRPWHRALITERAARFHLAHGVEYVGYLLLAQAREAYAAWGATAKVAQLDWASPALPPGTATAAAPDADQPADLRHQRSTVTAGTIDLLGILSASQALSSQTSLDRLHARVVELLGAMTGATAVHLLLWDADRQDWLLPTPVGSGRVSGSGHDAAVPLSVLRYVQRTGEPLLVADATGDDRFARDPYLADADCCSLLALPILGRGTLRAVLLLENRFLRGAFTADRLDAVQLVAGQLAVSLDNAQLYEQLSTSRARIVAAADQARRRIERDLHDGAQQRLVSLALQLRVAQAAMPSEPAARLEEVVAGLADALDELREIARGIHPAALADGGLPPALKTLARRSTVPVRLHVHLDRRLPEPVELAAYYAVAEALTNAAKHARATVVDVHVDTGDALWIEVRDDGRGGADPAGGTGLVGLTDRVEVLGGCITLHSPPGAGTSLKITLPLDT